jgi:hypothetical protein
MEVGRGPNWGRGAKEKKTDTQPPIAKLQILSKQLKEALTIDPSNLISSHDKPM